MNRLLWIIQLLLAALFLFAGGTKLVMSDAELTGQTSLSAAFLRSIGVLEILGSLGLVLPGVFHIWMNLTFIAGACLAIIMIGAVVVTLQTMGYAPAILPFVTGVLALLVAYGRWRLAPLRPPRQSAR